MSRVAKNPVTIPSGVEIKLDEKIVSVSGSKGKSEFTLPESVSAIHADDVITISYDESSSESTALAGTARSLINNMVIGVSEGLSENTITCWSWVQSES
jgi:large subunit ribosomal protein L6